ncbi:MAG: restriction endonuclease subunit S [Deltaproteobacteria bacterium]|nr:restriction endonuclease subunit S [Deltaproteobacteria bacterium]
MAELTENFDALRKPVKEVERRSGPYPYYGASGVVDHVDSFLFDGEYLLIAEDGENLRTRKTPIAFLARGKFWVNNHAHIVRGNSHADSRFLMYALSSVDIEAYLTGSTMPKLTQGNMNRIEFLAPPVTEQRAIARILGALDDKIDLNRRMSQTLEAMARALFKSWFVDFDPVRAKAEGRDPGLLTAVAKLLPDSFEDSELGEIPEGWRAARLDDKTLVVDCLHSKKPEECEEGMTLLGLQNIRDDGLLDLSVRYSISESDFREWTSRFEPRGGDCVITNVGRVGAAAQIPEGTRVALGRNMTGLRCRESFPFPTVLIECLLSDAMREEIDRKTDAGTILNALNVRNIPLLRFVCGPDDILTEFEAICRPLRARMEASLAESRTLAALRDTLLPKLVSGELRIPDAERIVGKAV